MADWIWYHWIVKKNYQHERMHTIYWTDKRGKPAMVAFYLAVRNIQRFHKCRGRWN